ncbi:MAG: pimeloyl-ACP methyl ester carboxylesterase [Zhongshania sp.]|jgi:pimeloyl-ACP methyl ester carboxylesterase
MSEKIVQTKTLSIAYQEFGQTNDPVILLIMGLGMQMLAWPDEFCLGLAEKGYRVVRLDNRDVGLSQKFDGIKAPSPLTLMLRSRFGMPTKVPYRLHDMAEDVVSLMDFLEIPSAHIVGASMGGMIAQLVAAHYPERTRTLTSIMSTSGARSLPQPSLKVLLQLTRRPVVGEDEYLKNAKKTWAVIGSPGYPADELELEERFLSAYRRSYYPQGFARQVAAIAASGDRVADLQKIRAPTLVIHGKADVLVPVQGGIDTARHIVNARLELIEGMGHDLPRPLLPRFIEHITTLAAGA